MNILSNMPQGFKLKFSFDWIKGMALNIIYILKKPFTVIDNNSKGKRQGPVF